MVAITDELLIFSDCFNSRVMSLSTSRGALSLLFDEADRRWLVSNCVLPDGPQGESMLVTELMDGVGAGDTRVVVTRRAGGSSFQSVHVLPLIEKSKVSGATDFIYLCIERSLACLVKNILRGELVAISLEFLVNLHRR